jgi:hypothetical protein
MIERAYGVLLDGAGGAKRPESDSAGQSGSTSQIARNPCLQAGCVFIRRRASSASARLPKPKVAGSRPVVRFSGAESPALGGFPGRLSDGSQSREQANSVAP